MKKTLFAFILITIIRCSPSDEPNTNDNLEIPKERCYYVVSISNGALKCDEFDAIELVHYFDWKDGGPFYPNQRIQVCITNTDYTYIDFRLGQKICDYSIYQ